MLTKYNLYGNMIISTEKYKKKGKIRMTEELQDKELTDIKYLRARMTGNVGLALDHAYNLGFFDGEKNILDKIRAELEQTHETMDGFLMHEGTKKTVLSIIDKYKAESEK